MTQATLELRADARALDISDINTTINHEPRILDVRLAEVLGFAQQRDMRKLIERHRTALERFGEVLRHSGAKPKTGSKGGRPTVEYWLTKKQALFICTKSETSNATEVTIQMVEVFDAITSGKPVVVKEHKVRAHRRALPKPAAEPVEPLPYNGPAMFEEGSNILLDLKAAIDSAVYRMLDGSQPDFHTALQTVLSDISWKRRSPHHKPQGFLGDWNGERARPELRREKPTTPEVQAPLAIIRRGKTA